MMQKHSTIMKIFLDTADVEEIKACREYALIDGVTTNSTQIRESGKSPDDIYNALADLGLQNISMEVSGNPEEMYDEAIRLSDLFGSVTTITLPMTKEGLQVCAVLNKELVRTNVSLIFNAAQALLASRAGATYVSPFVGRIDDQGYAGLEVVRSIASLFCTMGSSTEVLASSIRTPHRAVRSLFNGASIVTMPPSVFNSMYDHVLTEKGLEIFENDIKAITA